jgi:hypothetical protein
VLALTGCASTRLIDSEVRSFAPTASALLAAGSYRFERLPSQQANADAQTKIEAMARSALGKAGLSESASAAADGAQYTVQIAAKVARNDRANPSYDHWGDGTLFGGIPGRDYVVTGRGQVIYTAPWPRYSQPYYQREVSIVLRDAKTNTVVYETRALHEGIWADSEAILPAMFEAALQDFPKASEGPKRVNVEIAR